MFGLSTMEILIILAVALIFVGPDQLPKVARQIGKGVRQVRGAMGKVDDEMRRAVREAAAQFDDDGEPIAPPTPPAPTTPVEPEAGALPTPPATVTPPVAAPTPAPNAAPTERDWSQVGKAPVPGVVGTSNRIASAAPGRPTAAPDAPPDTPIDAISEAPPMPTVAPTTPPTLPTDPAATT
jgi:sec-independent protein translocase protein TatB